MKGLHYFFLTLFVSTVLLSCDKDEIDFPATYKFSHVDNDEEALYVLSSPTQPFEIDVNTGTYGDGRQYLKDQTLELIQYAFDLRQVDLLSENSLRIQIQTEEGLIDTTLAYTIEDEELVIEALAGTNLISYNSDEDAFYICGFTKAALPGPNVTQIGQQYNEIAVEDCQPDFAFDDYIEYVLDNNDYQALDTIGIFITRRVYTRQ